MKLDNIAQTICSDDGIETVSTDDSLDKLLSVRHSEEWKRGQMEGRVRRGQGSRNHDEEARHDNSYRNANEKMDMAPIETRDDEEDYLNQINEWTMSVQETRASTNRLYDRSKKKQIAGRQLREAIEKKHAPRAPTPSRKIRAEDASKMYDRAMMRKLSLELRREAEGINKQYVSPLLNPLVLSEENRPESRSRPDSRIRSRSRLRSSPLPNPLPVQSNTTRRSSTPNIRYSNSRSLTPSDRIPNTRVRSLTPNRNRRFDMAQRDEEGGGGRGEVEKGEVEENLGVERIMTAQETMASTNRLYERSKQKQIAGRQLREAIEKKYYEKKAWH